MSRADDCQCSRSLAPTVADLTFRRETRMGAWWDNKVTIYLNLEGQKLGFTANCVTAFLFLLEPLTGQMQLEQAASWSFNRDVYTMWVADEESALQTVERVSPILERFGVEMDLLHAQQAP